MHEAPAAACQATGSGDLLALVYLVIQAAFFALLRLGWALFGAR